MNTDDGAEERVKDTLSKKPNSRGVTDINDFMDKFSNDDWLCKCIETFFIGAHGQYVGHTAEPFNWRHPLTTEFLEDTEQYGFTEKNVVLWDLCHFATNAQ